MQLQINKKKYQFNEIIIFLFLLKYFEIQQKSFFFKSTASLTSEKKKKKKKRRNLFTLLGEQIWHKVKFKIKDLLHVHVVRDKNCSVPLALPFRATQTLGIDSDLTILIRVER